MSSEYCRLSFSLVSSFCAVVHDAHIIKFHIQVERARVVLTRKSKKLMLFMKLRYFNYFLLEKLMQVGTVDT